MFKAFYRPRDDFRDDFVNHRKNWIVIEMLLKAKCDALVIYLMVKDSHMNQRFFLLMNRKYLKYSFIIWLLCVIIKHKYQFMNRNIFIKM
jgi:hypothetical protein